MAEDTSRHYRRIAKTSSASPIQTGEVTTDDGLEDAVDQFIALEPVKQLVNSTRQSCFRHAEQKKRSLAQKRKVPVGTLVSKPKANDIPVVSLPFRFVPPSSLSPAAQKLYYSVLEDDTRQMANPHQYLFWAQLLDVHPMMAKARSLLADVTRKAWIHSMTSSGIAGDQFKSARELENYLELRQLQNEAYAKAAVVEGIKLYNEDKLKEALDYYKRAVNMDPKYAEAWYRASQVFAQKKNIDEAIKNLERALRIQPEYEEAKAMLQKLKSNGTSASASASTSTSASTSKEVSSNNDLIIDTDDAMKEYEERHNDTKKENRDKDRKKKREKERDRGRERERERDRDDRSSRHRRSRQRSRSRSPRRRRSESRERRRKHKRRRDSDSDRSRDRSRGQNKERRRESQSSRRRSRSHSQQSRNR
ncbi:hypothetical protein NQZ79_g6074 [Umbelopsis isabellina]|nr:hypothetical protein NQZ79_g6074 [Umbelopsis isabellina]